MRLSAAIFGFTCALILIPLSQAAAAPNNPLPADASATSLLQSWGPVIGAFVSFLAALATAIVSYRAVSGTLWQKTNESEIKQLTKKLDEFYGPFLQLAASNKLVSDDLRAKIMPKDQDYRLLIYLLNKPWRDHLTAYEKAVVDELCTNAGELDRLIQRNAGMVDTALLPYLARASAHFRMLQRAYRYELGTDAEPLKPYVYPRPLLPVLELEKQRITSRLDALRRDPNRAHPPMPNLAIPKDLELPKWPDPLGSASGSK